MANASERGSYRFEQYIPLAIILFGLSACATPTEATSTPETPPIPTAELSGITQTPEIAPTLIPTPVEVPLNGALRFTNNWEIVNADPHLRTYISPLEFSQLLQYFEDHRLTLPDRFTIQIMNSHDMDQRESPNLAISQLGTATDDPDLTVGIIDFNRYNLPPDPTTYLVTLIIEHNIRQGSLSPERAQELVDSFQQDPINALVLERIPEDPRESVTIPYGAAYPAPNHWNIINVDPEIDLLLNPEKLTQFYQFLQEQSLAIPPMRVYISDDFNADTDPTSGSYIDIFKDRYDNYVTVNIDINENRPPAQLTDLLLEAVLRYNLTLNAVNEEDMENLRQLFQQNSINALDFRLFSQPDTPKDPQA